MALGSLLRERDRGRGSARRLRRALLRPRLRLRRHAALAFPAASFHAARRGRNRPSADRGVVGLDLHELGHQLARSRQDSRAADAVRADDRGAGALDVDPRSVRGAGARLRARLYFHAGRAQRLHHVGAQGRQPGEPPQLSSASPRGSWSLRSCGLPAAWPQTRRGSGCGPAAIAFEFAGPAAGFFVPKLGRSQTTDWDISGAHMAERCGLFIIIALGELILVTGATFAELEWTWVTAAAFSQRSSVASPCGGSISTSAPNAAAI